MKLPYHFLCKLFFLFATAAPSLFAQITPAQQRTLSQLAARGEVTELRPLYDSLRASTIAIPPQIDLYCQLAFARNQSDYSTIATLVAQLEEDHSKDFTVSGLLALATERCEALRQIGAYEQLRDYVREREGWARRRRIKQSRTLFLSQYASLADRFIGSDIRSQLLGLADRGETITLLQRWETISADTTHLDTYARLRLLFAVALARHDVSLFRQSLTLFDTHLSELLDLERPHLLRQAMQQCLSFGEWQQAHHLCQVAPMLFAPYASLCQSLLSVPTTTVRWIQSQSTLPLTRDFPQFLPVSVNSAEEQPFLLAPTQGQSFISAADAADWNVQIIGDAVPVQSSEGEVSARPALLPILCIGSVEIRNLLVYVPDSTLSPPYNRSLGAQLLCRLGTLTFTDRHLTLTPEETDTTLAPVATSVVETLPIESHRPLAFTGEGAWQYLSPDGQAQVLPMSELRSFKQAKISNLRHQLTGIHPRPYQPYTLANYLQSGDIFGLIANESSLAFRLSDIEIEQMDRAINSAIQVPLLLATPRGLDFHSHPFRLLTPTREVTLPLLSSPSRAYLLSARIEKSELPLVLSPLHVRSLISRAVVQQLSLPLSRDSRGQDWVLLPQIVVGDLHFQNVLCRVESQLPDAPILLGLDVLSHFERIHFGSRQLTLRSYPLADRTIDNIPPDELPSHALAFFFRPSGIALESPPTQANASRPLTISDVAERTLDFLRLALW